MRQRIAVALACCLSFTAGGVFAQDAMKKDEMQKDGMTKKEGRHKAEKARDMHNGGMEKHSNLKTHRRRPGGEKEGVHKSEMHPHGMQKGDMMNKDGMKE